MVVRGKVTVGAGGGSGGCSSGGGEELVVIDKTGEFSSFGIPNTALLLLLRRRSGATES